MRKNFFIITTAVFLGFSILFGMLYFRLENNTGQNRYPLLAKRLLLEDPSDVLINFQPLRQEITKYLEETGLTYSFYFEYLFTGTSIGVGENNKLVGASLMKIPIVMDLYKAVEQGKIKLEDEVTVVTNEQGSDPEFGNQEGLKVGDKVTLRRAAEIALVESDNTAAFTIFEAIRGKLNPGDEAINNLDVETQVGESSQGNFVLIDARAYSSFLKCLYLSCFLNRDNSQEILQNLTQSPDDNRIRAGVPSEVEVVHKIGSFSDITQSDCGIVYIPSRRYSLCVMLDTDAQTARKHISEISKRVYEYVTNAN